MYGMFASAGLTILRDPTEDRDRSQRLAIREARIENDRSAGRQRAEPDRLLERARRALGLARTEPDCVPCPA